MADIIRRRIRDAAVTALTGLPTTGARVFASRVHDLQDAELPALRIYTDEESIAIASLGIARRREHRLNLIVECCAKTHAFDAQLDAMLREVYGAIDANQGLGGAKSVEPQSVETEITGDAERNIGVARVNFEALYYTALGSPTVAL